MPSLSSRRAAPTRWLSAILLLHGALLASSIDPRSEPWLRPIRNVDYTSHFYSANHFATHVRNNLAFWGYDPFWMAGYPEGFVGIVDNKALAAVTSLAPRGFEAAVFNAAVLLSLLSAPWILHLAVRASGGSAAAASGAALAATALTFGAPITVLFWIGGGISFFLSSALAVPAVLGLSAAIDQGSLASRVGITWVVVAMITVFIHPFAILPLAAGLALTPFSSRRPGWRALAESGLVLGLAALPLVPVATTVVANLAQTRVLDGRGEFLRGGPVQLFRDFGTHLLRTDDHSFSGAGTLAAVLLFAAFGLGSVPAAARRAILSVMALAAFLAYFATPLSERVVALQPHRFLVVLGFFAAVPAGWGIARTAARMRERRPAAWLLASLSLVIALEATWTLARVRLLASGADHAEDAIAGFLAAEAPDDGRALVESSLTYIPAAAGSADEVLVIRFALLPLGADREFLGNSRTGPFTAERYAAFGDGRILGRRVQTLSATELRDLLDRYAVSTVVGCTPASRAALDRFPEIVEPRAELADCRGYRVANPKTSRLLEGEGDVRADFDRITVRQASGERLV
ncbi:MAG: hypothetical protein ACREQQ_13530, partial [Candidatus Binatia bacterium]